jgi:uncharacterized protein YgbK (DUF1537 family)
LAGVKRGALLGVLRMLREIGPGVPWRLALDGEGLLQVLESGSFGRTARRADAVRRPQEVV